MLLLSLPGCGARTGLLDADSGTDAPQRPAAGFFAIETRAGPEGLSFHTGLAFWASVGEEPSPWRLPWEGDAPRGAVALGPNCFYFVPVLQTFLSAGDVLLRDVQGRSLTIPVTRRTLDDDPSEYRYMPDYIRDYALAGLEALRLSAPGDEVNAFSVPILPAPPYEGSATIAPSYSRTMGLSVRWQGVPPGAHVGFGFTTPFSGTASRRPSIECYFRSPDSGGAALVPPLGGLFASATELTLWSGWTVEQEEQVGALRLWIHRGRRIYGVNAIPISP